jgi:triosephosphate isomerase
MAVRKLVAGNWKMNGTRAMLAELEAIAAAADAASSLDVAICPPFTLIEAAVAMAPSLPIGAQDCHHAEKGAHTGCVSAAMIADLGAKYVIVGHSERRTDQGESDEDVQAKAWATLEAGLTAILCVGETEAERDAGRAGMAVSGQLAGSVPPSGAAANLVIAYEPVWAIGTGRTPSVADVTEMHGLIPCQAGRDPGHGGRERPHPLWRLGQTRQCGRADGRAECGRRARRRGESHCRAVRSDHRSDCSTLR